MRMLEESPNSETWPSYYFYLALGTERATKPSHASRFEPDCTGWTVSWKKVRSTISR